SGRRVDRATRPPLPRPPPASHRWMRESIAQRPQRKAIEIARKRRRYAASPGCRARPRVSNGSSFFAGGTSSARSCASQASDVGLVREVVRDSRGCHYNTRLARGKGISGAARDACRMYFLYRILTAAGMLVLAPYFALRGWSRGERAGALRERLG